MASAAYGGCVSETNPELRALCVGRHRFLSEHFARFFTAIGVKARAAVDLQEALSASREFHPHVVICEYELLATLSLDAWEQDELLSRRPVIAVSLTRRSHEAHLLDVNGIGGFLYLPTLEPAAAMRMLRAAASGPLNRYVATLPATPIESGMETVV
jgi:DNA-binding NarL/FixJ family response regulator